MFMLRLIGLGLCWDRFIIRLLLCYVRLGLGYVMIRLGLG